jgi:hypothetical protein
MALGKWGDGGLYGDGGLWNSLTLQAQEFYARVDEPQQAYPFTTTWNLQSPNGSIWLPSISTSGILSFTDVGAGTADNVLVPDADGTYWTPSISNDGIVSVTSGAVPTVSTELPSVIDTSGRVWYWLILDSLSILSSAQPWRSRTFYFSPRLKYTAPATNETPFRIYSTRAYVSIGAESLRAYEAQVEAVQNRISIRVKHSGSDFVMFTSTARANIKKKQVEG